MIFYKLFDDVSTLVPDKKSINDLTYNDVKSLVKTTPYNYLCSSHGWQILIDILVAARHNQPLVIPPKDGIDYDLPAEPARGFGIYLYTSGSSTGKRKPIFLSEEMLLANSRTAVQQQHININDIVYNVCSMNHTGGLNVQVIPTLLIGGTVIVEEFDPFAFTRRLQETGATITHLVPRMLNSVRNPQKHNLKLIAAGSDCIKKEHVAGWLDVGVPFMLNYGMTEAGPVIINHTFKDIEELAVFDRDVPLGSNITCDYRIDDSELFLMGNNISRDGWLATGDCVYQQDGWFFYRGRKSAGCTIIAKRY